MTSDANFAAPYKVAAIQFEPTMFEMQRNMHRLVELTEEAAASGARLIVHPEMATTGYCWANRKEIAPFVEPIPGPTTDRFGAIAAAYDCYIVAAVAEVVPSTGVYYNSAALVGPEGVIGVYRKTHSYISEPKWAKDGDLGIPVFETPLGRIGITICMDAGFPETGRIPALLGADVICFPTNWLGEPCPSPCWMARALENGIYFIAANRYGLERGVQFSGGSCVIAPDGKILASRTNGNGIVYATVDPISAQARRWVADQSEHKLADRRPDVYGSLTLNTYRWQDRDFHGLYGLTPLPAGRISKVVVAQFTPCEGEIDVNLATIESIAGEHAGADLIVFPELATTGTITGPIAAQYAASQAHFIMARVSEIAHRFNVHLVAGFVESDGDRLFNAAVVIGPGGPVGSYRKVHLTADDRRWASAGGDLRTFDLPVGRLGLAIGYDAAFPETTTCLAVEGADLIACPSLVSFPSVAPVDDEGNDPAHLHLWRERARETNTMIAFANGAAPFMGWSGIFGASVEDEPEQQSIIAGSNLGIAELTLDTTNLDTRFVTNPVRAKEIVAMRVPIWYDALQAPNATVTGEQASQLLVSQSSDD